MARSTTSGTAEVVKLQVETGEIEGDFAVPRPANGVILFAHGSGSSRHSPHNQFVARELQEAGMATLLIDLLTAEEEQVDAGTAALRFDVGLLATRLMHVSDWLAQNAQNLPIGYFGASTGAAAALVAAASRPAITAVVSRGGRPDLAGDALPQVQAATLLLVGSEDHEVVALNRQAYEKLTSARERELTLVPGATHLFEEPGTLEELARLAGQWFVRHLTGTTDANLR